MKILWITLESILPANTGGKIGVFKRLEQMAKWNDIYLFYPYDQDEELEQVVKIQRYYKKVYQYRRKENKKHAILNIWKYPFTVASRDITEMKKDIKKCIAQYNIDLINIDFPHMCVDILGIEPDIPIILNEHNIEWKVYRTIAKSHRNILKKVAYFIDSFRLYAYEKSLFKRLNFAQVTFVSSNDMEYMVEQKIVSQDKVTLIPVGADANNYDYFKQTEDEFNAYTKTLDPSDEAYGMTFEQFIDALLSAQIESITNSVQSIKISVADLSDCKSKLTADQKQMYANCGDIAKAYIAKIKSDVTFKPGADTSGYNTDDLGEITVVSVGGNWYIAG